MMLCPWMMSIKFQAYNFERYTALVQKSITFEIRKARFMNARATEILANARYICDMDGGLAGKYPWKFCMLNWRFLAF